MTTRVEPRYLGDGVYATYDGYQIELRLNDHREQPVIYLDPDVMKALVGYAATIERIRKEAGL